MRRRLAEHDRTSPAGEFERRDEGAGIEAEQPVGILEGAVDGKRHKVGAGDQLAESAVETGMVEGLAGIADDDSAPVPAFHPGKLRLEVGMDEQMRLAAMPSQPFDRGARRRQQFFVGNLNAHSRKLRDDCAAWRACGVADETERQGCVAQTLDGCGSARYRGVAIIDDTQKIQKHCAYHRCRMEKPSRFVIEPMEHHVLDSQPGQPDDGGDG